MWPARVVGILVLASAVSGCGDDGVDSRSVAMDRALLRSAQALRAPSAAAAVVQRGRLVWSGATGSADLATKRPMTARTPVDFASVGKAITAAVALALQDARLLSLDDAVRRWVRHWRGPRRVTLRQLLNHTSGIHDPPQAFFDAQVAGRRYTPRDWLAQLSEPDRRRRPPYEYANANYILAGMAMRAAAGARWDAVRHEVAAGLALQPDDRVDGPGARGYTFPGGGDGPKAVGDRSGYLPSAAFASGAWTAGAWAGSPEALAGWANRLFSGRILSAAALREMTTFKGDSGLGIRRAPRSGEDVWFAEGGAPGITTVLWHVPRRSLTVFAFWATDAFEMPDLPGRLVDLVEGGR
jgi:D-alanyl-D-alanine carboxypeptidase